MIAISAPVDEVSVLESGPSAAAKVQDLISKMETEHAERVFSLTGQELATIMRRGTWAAEQSEKFASTAQRLAEELARAYRFIGENADALNGKSPYTCFSAFS